MKVNGLYIPKMVTILTFLYTIQKLWIKATAVDKNT